MKSTRGGSRSSLVEQRDVLGNGLEALDETYDIDCACDLVE